MKTLPQFAAFVPVLLNTLFNFVKLLVLELCQLAIVAQVRDVAYGTLACKFIFVN